MTSTFLEGSEEYRERAYCVPQAILSTYNSFAASDSTVLESQKWETEPPYILLLNWEFTLIIITDKH